MKITDAKFRKPLISLIYCGLLSLQILAACAFGQATYYVSSSGNDANNGTSDATPWKTLNKVAITNFATSDRILFKRGDTLYGEFSKPLWEKGYIGAPSNHFYIGTYGTGDKPIIMMDCSNLVWTKRAGYDSIYAAPAIGFCYSSFGYEYINGEWAKMTQYSDDVSDLDNPGSLSQYLSNLTPSSYGPAHRNSPIDTVYCRTYDGLAPKVKILRQNIFKAEYLTMENLDFRNGFHALNPYPANNSIFRNLYMRNFIGITFFLAGRSSNNLVEACRADSGAYTAFYSWYSHSNLFRYDTACVVRDTVMGIYSNIEQAGFGAERDTATVWEYCYVSGADMSGWDTFYNFNDTIRYCKVENSSRGFMLQGVGWVAHDNTFISMGVSGDLAFKVDISYTWGENTYLTSGGRTHVYNNTITARGSGLWASKCAEGSSILFENNTVYGTVYNTNFSRLGAIYTTSISNTYFGAGRWQTGTWPNEINYYTLSEIQAAGYEAGSVWSSGPSTAIITVTPSYLSFGNVFVNATSQLSFTLSGSNLSPASGDITITTPAGYSVSLISDTGYTDSITCTYTGNTLSSTVIYVKFFPVKVQSYSGDITNTGGGAAIKNVAVTGTGIPAPIPILNVLPDTLAFSTVIIGTISSERTYTIQGTNLSPAVDTLTITAPEGYGISTATGSGFASSKRIAYTNGTIPATIIYVIFSPIAVEEYTGTITNTAGEITKDVAVTGIGIPATSAALTVNPTSLSFGNVEINTRSNEMSYVLTGLNLIPAADSLAITAPQGFSISTTSGSGFTSIKKIPYTGGTIQPIPKIIYVRFTPTSFENYTGNIMNDGGGASVQIVSVSGNGSLPVPSITIDPTSLSFGSVPIKTVSQEKTYTLSGINLLPAGENNTVMAPGGFEVSMTSGTGFNSSLTIAYSGGILSETTIYVRFSPAIAQDYTGNLLNTGGSAEAESVYVSGRGISVSDVENENSPTTFQLYQNYPNPFNPKTVIRYSVPTVGTSFMKSLILKVYDILGREIVTLVNEVKDAGEYTVEWNGTNSAGKLVGSGIYFYQLKTNTGFVITKKMLLIE